MKNYTFLRALSIMLMVIAVIVLAVDVIFTFTLIMQISSREYIDVGMRSDDYSKTFEWFTKLMGISLLLAAVSEICSVQRNNARNIETIANNTYLMAKNQEDELIK